MPCRALEAFGRNSYLCIPQCFVIGLNALSGIGGVRTQILDQDVVIHQVLSQCPVGHWRRSDWIHPPPTSSGGPSS